MPIGPKGQKRPVAPWNDAFLAIGAIRREPHYVRSTDRLGDRLLCTGPKTPRARSRTQVGREALKSSPR